MKLISEYANFEFLIGDASFKVNQLSLEHNGQQAKLTVKVAELLILFLVSADHVVDFETAISRVWLDNEDVGKKGVTNSIWMLRKQFKDIGVSDDIFESIPKVGYRLTLPVQSTQTAKNFSPKKRIAIFTAILLLALASLYLLFHKPEALFVDGVDAVKVTNYEGVEEHVAISDDGQYMAFTWIRDKEHSQIYIKNLNDDNAPLNLLSGNGGREVSPTWGPGNNAIAYANIKDNGSCRLHIKDLLLNNDRIIGSDCYYIPYRRIVTWPKEQKNTLIYAKQLKDRVALFSIDFNQSSETQLTFPDPGEVDYAPRYVNNQLYFIRETQKASNVELNRLNANGEATRLIHDVLGIVDFDIDGDSHTIYVNYVDDSLHRLQAMDFDGNVLTEFSVGKLMSSISYSKALQSVFTAEHISLEYISHLEFETGKTLQKISSGSRDLYGEYVPALDGIAFLSNRDKSWGVWLKTPQKSVNLTANLGEASVPRVHQPSGQIATRIRTPNGQNFIYILNDGEPRQLDLGELEPNGYSWSDSGDLLYFTAASNDAFGLYEYHLDSSKITQLSQSDEAYMVELDGNTLIVSRRNQNGLWRFNKLSGTFTLLTTSLSKSDFGAFFYQHGAIYFLKRTKENDQIIKLAAEQEDVMLNLPPNSVRKFFGIAKASDNSFIATMKLANEAEIYQYISK
ncbi:winged helix-turn-helix domain-containing protein [Thalassotalea litorea]|uniref:winged helix-turn-helix domain-containing protein n=1 Tax=Thalassotalea litorea TaxID=2020715 RepID=UPI0037368C98